MHGRLLRAAVSFLSGAVWALMLLSAVAVFLLYIRSSLFEAILYAFWVALFWLFVAVWVEVAGLQIAKYDELRRQSELLERIARRLDEKSP